VSGYFITEKVFVCVVLCRVLVTRCDHWRVWWRWIEIACADCKN